MFCLPVPPLRKFIKKISNIFRPSKSEYKTGISLTDFEEDFRDLASDITVGICDCCLLPVNTSSIPYALAPFAEYSSSLQSATDLTHIDTDSLNWGSDITACGCNNISVLIDVPPLSPIPGRFNGHSLLVHREAKIYQPEDVSAVEDPTLHYLLTFQRFCRGMSQCWEDMGRSADCVVQWSHHPLPPPSLVAYETELVGNNTDNFLKVVVSTEVFVDEI